MNRTKTGIKGFDELVGGGFVEGSTVLLSGGTGSGKTIFGLQFIYNGAAKFDEPGVYVILETRPEELRDEALGFGWDLRELEEYNSLLILDAASSRAGLPTSEPHTLRRGFDMGEFAEKIYDMVGILQAKRLVIDCVSVLGMRFSNLSEMRGEIFKISALLRSMGVTSLLISETANPQKQTRSGIEQFLTQGLVTFHLNEVNGVLKRNLIVWKMHQSAHSMKMHPFTIDNSGITVLSRKESKTRKR
ncbi:MAG: ATPase domain-containing protein [Candidatus Thorarchaeota archaeon]|nr:MAG: ATPase [Candidatus Thorarchaeota archaeon]